MTFDLLKSKVSNNDITSKTQLLKLIEELEESEVLNRHKIFKDSRLVKNKKLTLKQYFSKDNNEILDLFGKVRPSANKKTLFKNSIFFEIEIFKSKLKEAQALNIDLEYYHRSINNWSEMQNQKRTGNGWVATARNWMERDKEKNKLRFVGKNLKGESPDEMKEYLSL